MIHLSRAAAWDSGALVLGGLGCALIWLARWLTNDHQPGDTDFGGDDS